MTSPIKCISNNRRGRRCRNPCVRDSDKCHIHTPGYTPIKYNKVQCKYIKRNKQQCKKHTREGSLCALHKKMLVQSGGSSMNIKLNKVKETKVTETYNINNTSKIDLNTFMSIVTPQMKTAIENSKFQNTKIRVAYKILFNKDIDPENLQEFKMMFRERIMNRDDIDSALHNINNKIKNKVEEYLERGSGWVFNHVMNTTLFIDNYKPIKGSSYIELPKWIADKKCCINIKNDEASVKKLRRKIDDLNIRCFELCLALGLMENKPKNADQVSHYKLDNINIPNNVEYPICIKQIKAYEDVNNCAINVYGVEEDSKYIIPIRISNHNYDNDIKIVNMLIISNNNGQHYVYIKNIEKLIHKQITKNHENSKFFLCYKCLSHFTNEEMLINHRVSCDDEDYMYSY